MSYQTFSLPHGKSLTKGQPKSIQAESAAAQARLRMTKYPRVLRFSDSN
jgi:hypothetical protein